MSRAAKRTRVFFTVDVECAEERPGGGRVHPPVGWDLRVWGRFDGAPRDLGIGLFMDELEAFGLKGTFFVEALAAHHFGVEGLRGVCRGIRDRGHDLQLHLHPVLKAPTWHSRGEEPPEDDIGAYPVEEQAALLEEGIDLFARAGVPREEVVAFRAGNYGADNRTWEAMARAGLRVSSSYNLSYLGDTCAIDWPREEIGLFDTGAGVLELPISNFREPGGGYRHLQLTAVTAAEAEHYLLEARRLGIQEVTLVTHSFELFHLDSVEGRRGRLNRLNLRRLRRLCHFLRRRQLQFEVATVGSLAAEAAPPAGPRSIPRGSRRRRLRRLAEQAYKRAESRAHVLRR